MSNKLKKFLVDATKTHLEKIYEEKQMNDNGVYSPIEFTLSEKEQKKVNEKIREINGLFNSSDKANEYEVKAKAWDRTQALLEKCTHQTPGDDYEVDWYEFEIKIDEVISDYESAFHVPMGETIHEAIQQ